ncbi:hypothetical protein OG302_04825 [Streptomyces sp. NBC_01283]|uniref:hypothetical protein n=1 Tax=Streptomyces sp. NBC_01283 TaxID=2903812 RepID=UPI00352ECDD4|nr:hypothetical protein OG302_04825 [Streptomyces sp. NBC_01283]
MRRRVLVRGLAITGAGLTLPFHLSGAATAGQDAAHLLSVAARGGLPRAGRVRDTAHRRHDVALVQAAAGRGRAHAVRRPGDIRR